MTGFRDTYTLTLAFYDSELPTARVEELLARFREELRQFAG